MPWPAERMSFHGVLSLFWPRNSMSFLGGSVSGSRPAAIPITGDGGLVVSGSAATMGLTIASADLPDVITLYNNTQYLPFLEDGSTTPRAPFVSGWIAQTVVAWPIIVSRATARVRASLGG